MASLLSEAAISSSMNVLFTLGGVIFSQARIIQAGRIV